MRKELVSARLCVAAGVLGALVLAPSAAANTPAGAAQTPTGNGGGGVTYVATPKIAKVGCLRQCASRKRARGGSVVVVKGTSLGGVTEVTFLGRRGSSDNLAMPVRSGSDTRVQATVPVGAVSGPLAVSREDGARSAPSKSLPIMPAPPPEPNTELSPVPGPLVQGAPAMETGTSRTKAYVGARRAVTFSFRLSGAPASALTVELVRAADGLAVKTWTPTAVVAGEVQSLSWDGRVGRSAAQSGRYAFRLTAAGPTGAQATSSQAVDAGRDSFDLYDHVFPIRGKHDYGQSGARFGAGRSGHSHQGQDLFAKCGTKMVAARGGRVQFAGYHGAAGNYLVIDGSGTSVDYSYMHLVEPSVFREGDRVYTGQRIGEVGDSGNASGCHLHFEMWAGPGWYDGGDPFDPFDSLKAWDRWS